jgi:hypothetical protein
MASDQFPARIPRRGLTTTSGAYVVPVVIARAGDKAGWRYVEFFAANIRNSNIRRAYARAFAPNFSLGAKIAGLALTTDPTGPCVYLGRASAGKALSVGVSSSSLALCACCSTGSSFRQLSRNARDRLS